MKETENVLKEIDQDTAAEYQKALARVKDEVKKVIVGLEGVIEGILISVLSRGHVLLEGVPGLGKTMLVQTLGQCLNLEFSRIQFTPDLMPADITGTNILMEDSGGKRYFEFQRGPLFAQIILADEINRATPKTQSALLEAMQEQTITVAGNTHTLQSPFFVLATQNPLEMEGTYPLPEAQVDRFFTKLRVEYPSFDELKEILERTTSGQMPRASQVLTTEEILKLQDVVTHMPVAPQIIEYAVRLVQATHPQQPEAIESCRKYVRYGSSPRGGQALIRAAKARAFIRGRFNTSFDDVRQVAPMALRHRILLNFEGDTEDVDIDTLIDELVAEVPE